MKRWLVLASLALFAAATERAAIAATVVPNCPVVVAGAPTVRFGPAEMVPLCRDLYVEPALTDEERQRVARTYVAAREDVARFFGPLESPAPLALLCKTDGCRDYFGGTAHRSWTLAPGERLPGATHVAARLTILVLRVDDQARAVLAHETVHVELGFRLQHAHVPAWFDEGLATFVSGEPRCDGAPASRGVDDLRRLDQSAAWAEYTNTRGTLGATYCQARAEVDAWLRRSGRQRSLELLRLVRDGASFASLYGPLMTQAPGGIPTVIMSSAPSLGDGGKPFSMTLWLKPAAHTGVLAHVSDTPVGTGWCTPFLGHDRQQHLVAQLPYGPDPSSFTVVTDLRPRSLGAWTHVAMTWAPGGPIRLYVDGTLVGEGQTPRYAARGAGPPMYVAWGSSNVGGATCWHGTIAPGSFAGTIALPRVHDVELDAAEVAALARTPP